MKIISHRGNIKSVNSKMENHPDYIDQAISYGVDVEIDLRIKNGRLFLGHDYAQYEVDDNWFLDRVDQLWVHCKDIHSSFYLINNLPSMKFFCHTSDSFVLTNNNKIWLHDLSMSINDNVIIPLLSESDLEKNKKLIRLPYAICTDYVNKLESMFENE